MHMNIHGGDMCTAHCAVVRLLQKAMFILADKNFDFGSNLGVQCSAVLSSTDGFALLSVLWHIAARFSGMARRNLAR